jgi:hypothetical protein
MASPKSPFKVYQNFMSPKLCEYFCDRIGFMEADYDEKTKQPLKMVKFNADVQTAVYDRLINKIPELELYYGMEYRGTEQMMVEWFAEGTVGESQSENSNFVKKQWLRTRDRDFTGILFMSNYHDGVDFDTDYECYGGKLEFYQHKFGFNPEAGSLVIFPSVPHFINATAKVEAGELYQVRLHIAAKTPYLYDPSKFVGDYRTWFSGLKS